MEKNTISTCLFEMMNIFMEKYNHYYSCTFEENKSNEKNESDKENESDEENEDINTIKNDCIDYTKQLHCYLIEQCNFVVISRDLDKFIDKHINKSQDLNFVMITIGYLFSELFFNTVLNTKYESLAPYIKSVFHINLSQILFNKITLAQKYVDEEIDIDNKKEVLEYLIKNDIEMLKKIYLDIKSIPELDNSKNELMEYLCQHDLEDIYADDNIIIEEIE